MEHNLVTEIAICIIAAWVVGVALKAIRLPLLLAYLLAGFAIGPGGFGLITDIHDIQTISEIGLALLLFMIGLEIDLKQMLHAGRVITFAAITQVAGCVLLGWIVFECFGVAQTRLEALYLGVAAAMSSTVIIVKLLYDKRELETVPGRITLGILVLQDVFVILFLAIQPNLKNPAAGQLAQALGNVILLLAVAILVSRFVLPPVFRFIARLPELVLVGSIAWCFALSGLASYLGLSPAMGALIAGVMISTFPYTLDIGAKVTSIRDFFVTLFFVSLGMIIPLPTWSCLLWTVFFCLFLIVSRFVTVFPLLYRMRQGYRVSVLPAINLSQLSELSLVLLALGRADGDVSEATVGIAALSFAFLAVGSTFAILSNNAIFHGIVPLLNSLNLHDLDQDTVGTGVDEKRHRICLLGLSWTASSLVEEIGRKRRELLKEIVVIDFNPDAHEELKKRKIHAVYGDITARDVLQHAGVEHAEVIICSLPNTVLKGASNLKILRQLRQLNPVARIVVHAELLSDIPILYAAGASYVTSPRLLEAVDLLHVLEAVEKNLLDAKRCEQSQALEKRNEVIP